jgi:hypothetical protein
MKAQYAIQYKLNHFYFFILFIFINIFRKLNKILDKISKLNETSVLKNTLISLSKLGSLN